MGKNKNRRRGGARGGPGPEGPGAAGGRPQQQEEQQRRQQQVHPHRPHQQHNQQQQVLRPQQQVPPHQQQVPPHQQQVRHPQQQAPSPQQQQQAPQRQAAPPQQPLQQQMPQPSPGFHRQHQPPPLQLNPHGGAGGAGAPSPSPYSQPSPFLTTPTPSPFLTAPSGMIPASPMIPMTPRTPMAPTPMTPRTPVTPRTPSATPTVAQLGAGVSAMSLVGPGGDAPQPGGGARPKAAISNLGATAAGPPQQRSLIKEFSIPKITQHVKDKKGGTQGRPILVRANHFETRLSLKEVWRYDVKFQLPFKREVRSSDKPLLVRAFDELKVRCEDAFGSRFDVVFDGMAIAYSSKELPFGRSFEGQVEVREVEDLQRMVKVKVKLMLTGKVDMGAVQHYCQVGGTAERPTDAAAVINTLMMHMARADCSKIVVGRSLVFYKNGQVVDIGGGRSLWVGTFSSFRPAWKPFLNVDMANKPAYEEGSVGDFVLKVLNAGVRPGQHGRRDLQRLMPQELKLASQELKGLKIRMTINPAHKRDFRALGLGPPSDKPNEVHLEEKNQKMSICQYFQLQHKVTLQRPYENSVWVGNAQKRIFLPMELCSVKKQACPNSKKLTEEQTSSMIRHTAVKPQERQQRILQEVRKMKNETTNNPYAQSFHFSISDEMTKIGARVLAPPKLRYKEDAGPGAAGDQKKKDVLVQVKNGSWAMDERGPKSRAREFVEPKDLKVWGLLDLANVRQDAKDKFVNFLYQEGNKRGIYVDFPDQSCYNPRDGLPGMEKVLRSLADTIEAKHKQKAQLIMVFVTSRSGPEYAHVKLIGDTIIQISTQVVLVKNVLKCDPKTIHNICLKINSKLSGTNQVLPGGSLSVTNNPVMFVGADVTHPSPEALGKKPSIAAMVASCDPKISLYNCEISLQTGAQVVEVIEKTEDMIKSLLLKFFKRTQRKPQKIIYYRDGVSEGQFEDVLNRELSAFRRACTGLEAGYKPGITFLVAQKRHKTRLFPDKPGDGVGRMGNVPPGTVVDTVITSPTEESFFLASHEGIQGTTKPTGYHKLWDDNNLSPDEIQKMTFYLCHTYARCERSVSYPAPTYYAHLAAFRARHYHDALIDKFGGKDRDPARIPQKELDSIQADALINNFM